MYYASEFNPGIPAWFSDYMMNDEILLHQVADR